MVTLPQQLPQLHGNTTLLRLIAHMKLLAHVQEKNQVVYVTSFTTADTLLFSLQFAAYAKDISVLGYLIICLGPSTANSAGLYIA